MCTFYWQDLIGQLEKNVDDHHTFQESCNQLNSWIRVAKEKLVTCRDTYGDKITVQSKLDKCKVRH